MGRIAVRFTVLLSALAIALPLAAQSNPAIFPTGLTFGYYPTGSTAVKTVSVYNIGDVNITVSAITPSISQFTVVSGTLPVTLTPGQREDYGIQFKADKAKNFNGYLTFVLSGQPSQTVNVSGNGTNNNAVPSLSVTSLDFPSQPLGTVSPAQTLTITNNGTATFSVSDVIVTAPFSQTGWTGSTSLTAGQSLDLSITYAPTAVANHTGTVSLTYSVAAPNGVSLTGSGVNARTLGIGTYPTLPAATQGYAYQAQLKGTGGRPPYKWGLARGSSLPAGLTLSLLGMISGTVSSTVGVGNYGFAVQVLDAKLHKANGTLTLPVGSYVGTKKCNNISANASDGSGPLVPIIDLGTKYYVGAEEGGLYADGSNVDDVLHDADGQSAASAIVPLDANGNYSPTGKYVFISVGLSVTQQSFAEFVKLANTDPTKNQSLVIVNGATGGATASLIAAPNSNFWNAMVYDYLPNAGVTANQVVAAWVMDVNAGPTGTFPGDMTGLQGNLQSIAQNLLVKFPNVKLAYYSAINYTGYADGVLNLDPEPYGYENGMAVKNAIQDQIGGDPNMNYDVTKGKVKAPWIAWGPYYWTNGMIPREDGLVWTCQDVDTDGTHPSNPVGRIKVSSQILHFLKTDDTASKWFLAH